MNLKLDRAASQLICSVFAIDLVRLKILESAMFTKPTFMTGQVYKEFRNQVLSKYVLKSGFVMNAKDFEGVKKVGL